MQTRFQIPEGQSPTGDHTRVTLPRDEFLAEFIPTEANEGRMLAEHWAPQASEEVRQGGVDVIASYVSFRKGPSWGISIKKSGVLGLAGHLIKAKPAQPDHAVKAAYRVLYDHELFHFQVDCAYLRLESVLQPHGLSPDPFGKSSAYALSRTAFHDYDPLEEALANARALHQLTSHQRRKVFAGPLRDFLKDSPAGYRDFGQFSNLPDFRSGLDALFNVDDKSIKRSALVEGIGALIDLKQSSINGSHPPTYLVRDC